MINNEPLNDKCYQKLVFYPDGGIERTLSPPEVLLRAHSCNWQIGDGLMIGYEPMGVQTNRTWERLRQTVREAPRLFGTFILWRFGALMWSPDVALNELTNFLVSRYQRGGHRYHFCDFKRVSL